MKKKTVAEMRQERARIHKDVIVHLNKVVTDEERKMTPDEQVKWNKAFDDFEDLGKQIEDRERLEAADKAMAERQIEDRTATKKNDPEVRTYEQRYASAFNSYLRKDKAGLTQEERTILDQGPVNPESRATQVTTTPNLGGYLVQDEYSAEIIKYMKYFNGIMNMGHIMRTSTGAPFNYPVSDATLEEGEIVAEAAATSEMETLFGTVQIGSHTYSSKEIPISYELLQDSAYDIQGHIRDVATMRLGRITERHMTEGTGVGQPEGILTSAPDSTVTVAPGSISRAKLIDLIFSLDRAYIRQVTDGTMPTDAAGNRDFGSAFTFHQNTLRDLMKLDIGATDARPLWTPSMREGEPNRIHGFPYHLNNYMPDLATSGNKAILFGDFKKYKIRVVKDTTIMVAKERRIEKFVWSYFGYLRLDAKLTDPNAIKFLSVA